jgi:hypothetical protein
MPTKEELEAELNASEKDKAIAKLRELIADIDEWEADLQALEESQRSSCRSFTACWI